MLQDEAIVGVAFNHSDETNQVPLNALVAALTGFLDQMGVQSFVGEGVADIIRTGDGPTKLERLLKTCGYPGNPEGFFQALLPQLGTANGAAPIAVNGIELPYLMMMALMEVVLPGNQFISVKSTTQLEKLANITMIMTTPFCPYAPALLEMARNKVEETLSVPTTIEMGMDMWDLSYMEEGAGADWGLF